MYMTPSSCTAKIVCSPHHHKDSHLLRSLSLVPSCKCCSRCICMALAQAAFQATHCLFPLQTQASVPLALSWVYWTQRCAHTNLQSKASGERNTVFQIWKFMLLIKWSQICVEFTDWDVLLCRVGQFISGTHFKSMTVSVFLSRNW